jgi:TRAP-type C4-dicarboxylate transport system permease small subunit
MRSLVLKAIATMTGITRWLVIVAAIAIGVLMVVNFFDIIGTKFFGMSIPGALDISEDLMVLVTLLPIAYIALERGHIRITLLEEHLHSSIRYALEVIQYFLATLITGFVTLRAFAQLRTTLETMELKTGLDLPIWPANVVVVVSFGFLTLVWLLLLAKALVTKQERDK